jgi:phage terminase small subunit
MEDQVMGDNGHLSQERVMTKTDEKKTKRNFPEQKDVQDARLSDRERLFCEGLVQGKTNYEAYLSAGYKAKNKGSANTLAGRLLQKVDIQKSLGVMRTEAAERYRLTPNKVLFQTGAILNSDMGDYMDWGPDGVVLKPKAELTDVQRAAIESITETVTKDGGTVKFTLHSKPKAMDLGAKILKMVSDKPDPLGEVTLRIIYDEPKGKTNGD